jgi:hypothetical protein
MEMEGRIRMLQYTGIINIIFEDIPRDHELFALGTKFTADDPDMQPDTVRIIKMADAKGREHECILALCDMFYARIPQGCSIL